MFILLLMSTRDLPLPITIFFSGKCRICIHGLTLVLQTTTMLPTAPRNLPWPGTPVHIPHHFLPAFLTFTSSPHNISEATLLEVLPETW